MKYAHKHLTFLIILLLSPFSAHTSLKMLMGGDSEPDPDAMNFPILFKELPRGRTFENSATFLSQDGKRSLRLRLQIKTTRNGNRSQDLPPLWATKKEEKKMRDHLPSLAETPTLEELFEHFIGNMIQNVLGEAILPTSTEEVKESYVSALLKLKNIAIFLESPARGDAPDTSASPTQESRPFKRPRFSTDFVLNTLYSSKERDIRLQIALSKYLAQEDQVISRIYLAPSGYLKLSLKSFPTPDTILRSSLLMANARRIPVIESGVIIDLQGWLETYCNVLYKTHVLDKGGESMYQ